MLVGRMSIFDITSSQLKRAAAIKEHIEKLNKELASILGGSANPGVAPKKMRTQLSFRSAAKPKKKTMNSATRAKLSAKLKAYWAAKRSGKK